MMLGGSGTWDGVGDITAAGSAVYTETSSDVDVLVVGVAFSSQQELFGEIGKGLNISYFWVQVDYIIRAHRCTVAALMQYNFLSGPGGTALIGEEVFRQK